MEQDEYELLEDGLSTLRLERRASVSLLQRRLRINYNRAVRMLETFETLGLLRAEGAGGIDQLFLHDPQRWDLPYQNEIELILASSERGAKGTDKG